MSEIYLVPAITTDGTGGKTALCEAVYAYSNLGADAVKICIDTDSDEAHENAVLQVKAACRLADCPVYVKGGVYRLEDVKKFLYAGADKVLFGEVIDRDGSFVKETAAARFGAEKITLEHECICYYDCPVDFDFFAEKQRLRGEGKDVAVWESPIAWSDFKTLDNGLVPVIVQAELTGEVLMLAYMNEEAFAHTLATGRMTYWSRSRQELWVKGDTSGHYQFVRSLKIDCDNDTLLATVHQVGAACHTGAHSCFYRTLVDRKSEKKTPAQILDEVYAVIMDRKEHPKAGSYTNYLFDKGIDKILKKVGEEACEILIAAKNPEPEETIYELSDFLYHAMVLMAEKGITWEEVTRELANR